ncbi:hypothetical protein [Treponema sp. R6D11]
MKKSDFDLPEEKKWVINTVYGLLRAYRRHNGDAETMALKEDLLFLIKKEKGK